MTVVIRFASKVVVFVAVHYAAQIVINTINKEPRPIAQAFRR